MEKRIHLLHNSKIALNKKGFTATEMMVVIAIISVVVLGNTFIVQDFFKKMAFYEKESLKESELAILNVMALNVLKKSSHSLNMLSMADDTNRNFFDYYPDLPIGTMANEERIFALTNPGANKYFYIVATDEDKNTSTVYDPRHAYTVTAIPADLLGDGSVSYKGLNSVPDIDGSSGGGADKKIMTQMFGNRWATDELFIVNCPTYLRPKANISLSLTTVPRMPSFLGRVVGDGLEGLTFAEVGVNILNRNPLTNLAYTNLNNYFMTLPTVGGAAPFVKVEPVQLNRFELRGNPRYKEGQGDLYMSKWRTNGYGDSILIASEVKSVIFRRKSVSLPLISLEVSK